MSGFEILDQGSLPSGAKPNEDCCGVAGALAWVLDGATGLGRNVVSAESDAAWFAHRFGALLAAQAPGAALEGAIEAALATLAQEYTAALQGGAVEAYERPSAAGVILRAEAQGLQLIGLGDCRAFWMEGGALRVFGGGALDALDAEAVGQLVAFLNANPNATLDEARAQVWPLLRQIRAGMNTEGGYWAWAPETGLTARADRALLPAAPGRVLLLATDGFTRLWDTFAIAAPEEAFAACASGRGAELAAALRAAETADASGRAAPRFKQFDDLTWLCLRAA